MKPTASTSVLDQLACKESERHCVAASHSGACTSITKNCHLKIMAQRNFSELFIYHLEGCKSYWK